MCQPSACTAPSPPKFALGQTVITANAKAVLPELDVVLALQRHQAGDWGELCEQDRKANEDALQNGERLFSVYKSVRGQKFYVITEWDRSITTVLLPEDY